MTGTPASGDIGNPALAAIGVGVCCLGLFFIFRARAIWNFELSAASPLREKFLRAPGYPHGIRVVGAAFLAFGLVLLLGVARDAFPDYAILPGFLDHPSD